MRDTAHPTKKSGKRYKVAHPHALHTWVRPVWTVVDSPIWSEVHCSIGAMRRDPPTVMGSARCATTRCSLPSFLVLSLGVCLDRGRPRAPPPRQQGGY